MSKIVAQAADRLYRQGQRERRKRFLSLVEKGDATAVAVATKNIPREIDISFDWEKGQSLIMDYRLTENIMTRFKSERTFLKWLAREAGRHCFKVS